MSYTIENISINTYQAHWLHHGDSTWALSNCYVDLWIEALHSLSLNPIPCLAFTPLVDFEGDQWTFFKVPLHDLLLLYGIDVQELNIWQSLLEHIVVQISRNRLVLMEVDAFYLPDVSDTNYHQEHEKTTIGVQMIDTEHRLLGYFHNGGYYTLCDTDFDGVFRVENLPPYVEYAKLDALIRRSDDEMAALASQLLKEHLSRRPQVNPFLAYSQQFQQHTTSLQDLASFHKYAFATIRQYGSCYQYAALFLRWLMDYQGSYLGEAAEHFTFIANTAQVLLLQTARAVKTKKPFAYPQLLYAMQEHWEQAMDILVSMH